MLDPKLLELASRRIGPRFGERRDVIHRELARAAATFAARGTLDSGMHYQRRLELCQAEAETRARMGWQLLAEVVAAAGLEPTHDLAEALKKAFDDLVLPGLTGAAATQGR